MPNSTDHPPSQTPSKTVLLVHHDLGFVMWLGQKLAEIGHVAIPATEAKEALGLIEELAIPTVDLLVANPASPETTGLINTLQSRQGTLEVVAIEDPYAVRTAPTDVRADPSSSLSECLMIVLRALGKEKAGGPD
jgi:DNA-binding NtrC family response regulator